MCQNLRKEGSVAKKGSNQIVNISASKVFLYFLRGRWGIFSSENNFVSNSFFLSLKKGKINLIKFLVCLLGHFDLLLSPFLSFFFFLISLTFFLSDNRDKFPALQLLWFRYNRLKKKKKKKNYFFKQLKLKKKKKKKKKGTRPQNNEVTFNWHFNGFSKGPLSHRSFLNKSIKRLILEAIHKFTTLKLQFNRN